MTRSVDVVNSIAARNVPERFRKFVRLLGGLVVELAPIQHRISAVTKSELLSLMALVSMDFLNRKEAN